MLSASILRRAARGPFFLAADFIDGVKLIENG